MVEACELGSSVEAPTMLAPSGALARFFSFPVVLLMTMMLVLALFASNAGPGRDVSDPDIWWHLENGRQLLSSHRFMQLDTYSFTVAGKPWINFEWLSELPFYMAFHAFGLRGVFWMSLLVGEAIIGVVYLLCYMRSRDVKAAFLATGIAVLLACISLAPRTLLFGWLFLAAELGVLWAYKEGRNYLWALPPMFVVWVNMHGSWVFGMFVLLLFVGCSFVQGKWGAVEATRLEHEARKPLLIATALSAASLFANPYGWKLPLYPFLFAANQGLNVKFVSEWASLDFHAFFGKFVLGLVVLLALATLARKRTWQLFDLLLVLFAIYAGFTYTRFIFMTGIVLAPFVAIELRGVLGPYEKHLERPWVNAVAMTILAAILVWRLPSERALAQHRDETFPVDALTHLQQLPAGNVFNAYEWGGYIIRTAPSVPVFIDSRADIYVDNGIFSDYVEATRGSQTLETLDKYKIKYVLLQPNTAMSYILAHNAAWHTEFKDDRSVLFARRS